MPVLSLSRFSAALAVSSLVIAVPASHADEKSPAPIEYAGQGSVPRANSSATKDAWRGPVTQSGSAALPSSRVQLEFSYPGSSGAATSPKRQLASVENTPSAAAPRPSNPTWPEQQMPAATTGPRQLTLSPAKTQAIPERPSTSPIEPDFVSATAEERGLASWYGSEFHGQLTANGETFDMYAMTAAHPSLPLPSLVQVTNERNGKEVVVRVNDRGPFGDNRIIDLSHKAADALGFAGQGTATVTVRYLGPAPELAAQTVDMPEPSPEPAPEPRIIVAEVQRPDLYGEILMGGAEPSLGVPDPGQTVATPARLTPLPQEIPARTAETVKVETLNPLLSKPVEQPARVFEVAAQPRPLPEPKKTAAKIFLQVGAFADISNAQGMNAQVGRQYPVDIESVRVNGADYFRVLVGPFPNRQAADLAKYQLSGRGIKDGFVVLR